MKKKRKIKEDIEPVEPVDKNIGIYVITNLITGAKYIGQSRYIYNRKLRYKTLECQGQIKVYNNIKKYGWKNFKFEVEVNCKIEDLNRLEFEIHKKYFDELGADLILNCRAGGGATMYVSEETREKLRIAKTGVKHTEETRKRLIKLLKTESEKSKINQYTLQGEYITTKTTMFVAKFYDNKIEDIHRCCKGKLKSAFGYIWKYNFHFKDCQDLIIKS